MDVRRLLILAARTTHEGQRLNQRQHALRCATEAQLAGATPELITAALVHDLAKPLDVVRHGELIANACRGLLPPVLLSVLMMHGDYVAVLNHGDTLDHNPDDLPLVELCKRFAHWDHAALQPGPVDPTVVDVALSVIGCAR